MKTKIIIIISLIFLFLSFLLAIFYFYKNYQISKINVTEVASTTSFRVEGVEEFRSANGDKYQMFANSRMTTTSFIFQDSDGGIVTTLSIDNQFIGPPTYFVIKGKSHDWLVVSRQGTTGSSIKNIYDEWYTIGYEPKVVLSYESDGYVAAEEPYKYWKATILSDMTKDDSKVDVKTTYRSCKIDEKVYDKECEETSKIDNYVWDNMQEMFVGGTDDKILP